ncbi:MAG: DUF6440 family protein [Clostridium sp.]|nr:DUF6440 family protein [Clostridium sp.]
MFKSKEKRFKITEEEVIGLTSIKIIVDTVTGVNYLQVGEGAVTPLLDANGNVVIDTIVVADK